MEQLIVQTVLMSLIAPHQVRFLLCSVNAYRWYSYWSAIFNLYCALLGWSNQEVCMGEMNIMYRILIGKPEGII